MIRRRENPQRVQKHLRHAALYVIYSAPDARAPEVWQSSRVLMDCQMDVAAENDLAAVHSCLDCRKYLDLKRERAA